MKRFKSIVAVMLIMSMTFGLMTISSAAATRKKITSLSLSFTSNIELDTDISNDSLEIETTSDRYIIDSYEFQNDSFRWEQTDVPKIKIYLLAEDDYYFSVSSVSVILKGAGAKYVSHTTQDSSKTLILTVTLSPLNEIVGAIPSAVWSDTTATWEPAIGAGSYEVRLLRDGTTVGTTKILTETSYNFSTAMTKAGTYTFRVRPVNSVKPDNKGEWMEAETRYIDNDMAARIRENGSTGVTAQPTIGWIQDNIGWWYRNADGSYTTSNWQFINNNWYYFADTGYMVIGWVQWDGKWYYCKEDGSRMVNGTTPEGFQVGADGVWIP